MYPNLPALIGLFSFESPQERARESVVSKVLFLVTKPKERERDENDREKEESNQEREQSRNSAIDSEREQPYKKSESMTSHGLFRDESGLITVKQNC